MFTDSDPSSKCQNRKKSVTSDKSGGTDLQTCGKKVLFKRKYASEGGHVNK